MKLHNIAFQGYKAYGGGDEDESFQQFQLAPLTLVLGKNNSGKSAAVRLLRLLLGGLECTDGALLPLEVRGTCYGQNFLDLVHGGAFFRRPAFHIVAEHAEETLDLRVTLYSPGALAVDDPPRIWSYEMRTPEQISIPPPRRDIRKHPVFAGLLPPDARWNAWRKAAGLLLDTSIHLGPTRAAIEPVYANEPASSLSLRGSEAPQLLRLDSGLADEVGLWFSTHMEGWRLSLKRDSDSFSVRLHRGELSTNLAQAGEGLQQVLPVVVHQLWRQRQRAENFLDLIEQPEIHLHAAVQAPLADLFIDTALRSHGQTVVETNAEPILLRVQRRVAEGTLAPNQLAIYYVESSSNGSLLRRVEIHKDGELDWWPSGVFEENFLEVAAIRRAQRSRSEAL